MCSSHCFSEEKYAWEWIKNDSFKLHYEALVSEYRLPDWALKLSGPSSRSYVKEVEGIQYTVVQTCKPHDCSNQNITLFYNSKGNSFALFNGHRASFIGNPTETLQEAILNSHVERYNNSDAKKNLGDRYLQTNISKSNNFKFNVLAAVLFAKSSLIQYLDKANQPYDILNSEPIVVSGVDKENTKIVMVIYPYKSDRTGNYHAQMYIKDGYFHLNACGTSIESPESIKENFLNNPGLYGE
jgi:hypothetical protein